jgi:hypothetical protein
VSGSARSVRKNIYGGQLLLSTSQQEVSALLPVVPEGGIYTVQYVPVVLALVTMATMHHRYKCTGSASNSTH